MLKSPQRIFKKILIATFAVAAFADASAFAETSQEANAELADQPEPILLPSRQLQNLIFFAHQGVLEISPSLLASTNDHASQNAASDNSLTSSIDRRKTTLEVDFVYGLTNRLRVGLAETELFSSTADTTASSTNLTTRTSAEGLSDPEFTASYRWAEFQLVGLYADVTFSATPNIGTKLKAQPAQDGNNLQGGWSGTISLPLYWLYGSNEFNLRGTFKKNFDSTALGADATQNTDTASHWLNTVTIQDRYHFLLDRLYIQLGLVISLPSAYTTTTNGNSTSASLDRSLKKVVTLGCLLNERIAVSVDVSSSSTDSSTTPASGIGSRNARVETDMGLNANFLF